MPYPKRLIETDLPIKRISAHARREKSIRHGHISTLHIWWARRPLAACRAVLCAALWPDPADPLCPPTFRQAAITHLSQFAQKMMQSDKYHSAASEYALGQWRTMADPRHQWNPDNPTHQTALQGALFHFIADFANWDNATNDLYLTTARALTQIAHESLGGQPGTRPLVVDPFAGGGAIPLEALRVGADAFASDLNPVAVLLNKVVLEYIPRYGQQLADEVRKWGQWIKEQAEQELARFYPPDPDGAIPIAYLWARTITCEGPGCGAEVPLMRSLWLAKRSKNAVALRLIPNRADKRVDFAIIEDAKAKDVGEGTVKRGSATCPCCGYTTPVESVRKQLRTQQGGANTARLFAIVVTYSDRQGRFYRLPTSQDLLVVQQAIEELKYRQQVHNRNQALSLVPDESLPPLGALGFRVQRYGMEKWGDLFTSRQALALITLSRLINEIREKKPHLNELGTAIQTCLAFALDKQADLANSLNRWEPVAQCPRQLFGRQAIPIVWDFAEGVPIGSSSGSFEVFLSGLISALEKIGHNWAIGQVENVDATTHPLPNQIAQCFFTDPPYYDAVPYADLSDFFYVWLKRSVGQQHEALFSEMITPKIEECILDEAKNKDKAFFENSIQRALSEGNRVLAPRGIGIVVFAHKSTSGWEAQLQGMLNASWTITGSWPIDTENASRLRAQDSAALASSVHLVCRPRETNEIGDWREVLQELPGRINAWLPRLAQEGVVGADAIFACLGPALEIFSRYARVEKASGEPVPLGEYLEHVWAAVSKEALNMVFAGADTTGFEEDARLTAIWLWTLTAGKDDEAREKNQRESDEEDEDEDGGKVRGKPSAGYVLEYDAARKISQGLGAHLEQLTHLVEVKGENARLLPVLERTRFLFGHDSLKGERPTAPTRPTTQQLSLFELLPPEEKGEWHLTEQITLEPGTTTLDKIHQSMLLFAAGRSDALKQFLVHNGVGQDERFWRLAQALSALYPSHTDEKRWVDGVLARKKSLGF